MSTIEEGDVLSHGLKFGSVDDQGRVWIKDTEYKKGKIIGALDGASEEEALSYYAQQYFELEEAVNDVIELCETVEDATPYLGKINYLKEKAEIGASLGDHQVLIDRIRKVRTLIGERIEVNTEKKKSILEKVEQKAGSTDWKNTSKELQELIHAWENIGLIKRELKSDFNKRFDRAKDKFFTARKQFFSDLEAQKELNELLKDTIVRKAGRLENSTDFKEAGAEFQRLFEEWKSIGMVSTAEKNQELWEKFAKSKDNFYARLKEHHAALDEARVHNLSQKELIVAKAEEVSQTEDFKATHGAFDQLMELWRSVGPVPREVSETIWEKFSAARQVYYDRRRAFFVELDNFREENTKKKEELLTQAKAITQSEDWKDTTAKYKNLMDEWKTIGSVVSSRRESIWNEFIEARDEFFGRKEAHTQQIREEQQHNIPIKQAIIDKAKELSSSEKWKETTEAMKGLMDEWKSTGSLPKAVSEEMWGAFNEARDFFFQKQKAFYNEKDKQRAENLVLKEALCERAEELSQSTSYNETHQALQELMQEWKKVGQAPRELNEAIWERFKAAFDVFYEKRNAYFKRRDAQRARRKEQDKFQAKKSLDRQGNVAKQIENEIKEAQSEIEMYKFKISQLDDSPMGQMFKDSHERNIKEVEAQIVEKRAKIAEIKAEIKAKSADLEA